MRAPGQTTVRIGTGRPSAHPPSGVRHASGRAAEPPGRDLEPIRTGAVAQVLAPELISPVFRPPRLGVGLAYFRGLEGFLATRGDLIDVLEIEPQSLVFRRPRATQRLKVDEAALARLRELPQKKVLHGIGSPVGGLEQDTESIPALRRLGRELGAPWISEHLNFNRSRDARGRTFSTGFLMPPRQTPEGAATAARSIRMMAAALELPFAVENGVSYLRPRPDELSDGTFLSRAVEPGPAGIVLDLHNAWTNAQNGRQPVERFLDDVPLERVWELHLAGGFAYRGYWLDSHSGEPPEEVMAIARDLLPHLPNLGAIVLELFPAYLPISRTDRWIAALERLHRLWEHVPAVPRVRSHPSNTEAFVAQRCPGPDQAQWEAALGGLMVGRKAGCDLARELASDPGVELTRELLNEFRASMLVAALPLTSRLLMLSLGPAAHRDLLGQFWRRRTPRPYASDEALSFSRYLDTQRPPVQYLHAVVAYERARILAATTGRSRVARIDCDPLQLLRPLAEGRLPVDVPSGAYEVELVAVPDTKDRQSVRSVPRPGVREMGTGAPMSTRPRSGMGFGQERPESHGNLGDGDEASKEDRVGHGSGVGDGPRDRGPVRERGRPRRPRRPR